MEGREILPVINFGVLIKNARAAARGSSASSFFSFHSRSPPPSHSPSPPSVHSLDLTRGEMLPSACVDGVS